MPDRCGTTVIHGVPTRADIFQLARFHDRDNLVTRGNTWALLVFSSFQHIREGLMKWEMPEDERSKEKLTLLVGHAQGLLPFCAWLKEPAACFDDGIEEAKVAACIGVVVALSCLEDVPLGDIQYSSRY